MNPVFTGLEAYRPDCKGLVGYAKALARMIRREPWVLTHGSNETRKTDRRMPILHPSRRGLARLGALIQVRHHCGPEVLTRSVREGDVSCSRLR